MPSKPLAESGAQFIEDCLGVGEKTVSQFETPRLFPFPVPLRHHFRVFGMMLREMAAGGSAHTWYWLVNVCRVKVP